MPNVTKKEIIDLAVKIKNNRDRSIPNALEAAQEYFRISNKL